MRKITFLAGVALACVLVLQATADTCHIGPGQPYPDVGSCLKTAWTGERTLVIHGRIREKEKLKVENAVLALAGSDDACLELAGGLECSGTVLTLGDVDGGSLRVEGGIRLRDGSRLITRDGIQVHAPSRALDLADSDARFGGGSFEGAQAALYMERCTADLESGHFSGSTAVWAEACSINAIRDGTELSGISQVLYLSRSAVGDIQGGVFRKTGNEGAESRAAVYADHGTRIGRISGGRFSARSGAALLLIRGAQAGEICGGSFLAENRNGQDGFCHHALTILAGSDGYSTGIETVSGGTFTALGQRECYGAFVFCNASGSTWIRTILGHPVFSGSSGLVIGCTDTQGNAWVDRIEGGEFEAHTGSGFSLHTEAALANCGGEIGMISGGCFRSLCRGGPAFLQTSYCGSRELASGGGRTGRITGGEFLAPAGGCAVENSDETSVLGAIRDGLFIGSKAVDHRSQADLVIEGGTFFATDRTAIHLQGTGRLFLEPGLTGRRLDGREKGSIRIMVRDYLMDGVEDRYLIEAEDPDQVIYPQGILTSEDTAETMVSFAFSGSGETLPDLQEPIRQIAFRFLTPAVSKGKGGT